MSREHIERVAKRMDGDPRAQDRFIRLLVRADELVAEATKLRKTAWLDYRRVTGEFRPDGADEDTSPYA